MKYQSILIALVLSLLVPIAAFGGAAQETEEAPRAQPSPTGVPTQFSESPMLAARVQAGELPSVDERLPVNPVVVDPVEGIGKYGGTIRMGFAGRHFVYNSMLAGRFTDHEAFTWAADASELTPNWLEDYTVSPDGTVFTIRLREGIRWSDGQPVTMDDLLFNYVDIPNDTDLVANPPSWIRDVEVRPGGEFTLEFRLPQPAPLFVYTFQGASNGVTGHLLPKHYMQQFHPDYADADELQAMADAEGVDDWSDIFLLKAANDNPDRPNLGMWRLVEASSERAVLERNPYYWKVDTAGNQLPYVDSVRMEIVASGDVVTLRAMAGEYDFTIFHLQLADYPTLTANEAQGGYRSLLWTGVAVDSFLTFNLNYDDTDPAMAEVLRTPEFRKGLSHAIDREEINELIFLGTGKPVQISPMEGSSVYDPRYPTRYASYDPERASQLLDEAGLAVGSDGWRTRPDGQQLRVELLVSSDWANHLDIAELIADYWQSVNVQVDIQAVSFERRSQLEGALSFEVSMWKVDNLIYPTYLTAARGFMTAVAQAPQTPALAWWDWVNSNGQTGVEPPQWFLDDNELFKEILRVADDATRDRLTTQLWERYYEDLWTVGIIQEVPSPIIVANRLRNVPDVATNVWPLRTPVNAGVFQWYLER